MKNSVKIISVLLVILLSLSACSQTSDNNDKDVDMVTINDVKGEVSIPKDPQRVVDLSGNSDILSILGYDVIGTANSDAYDYTKFPTYLEDILQGATILGYSMQDTMDVEAVMNLRPDLIIISTVQEKMYDQLSKLAPTVMIELEALDWSEDVKSFAKVFNKEDVANEWLTNYFSKAEAVGKTIKENNGEHSTYLAFLASGGQFFIFDNAGFGGVLYNDMQLAKPKGMPEQSDISLPVVTYEGLANIETDYIFLISTSEDKALLDDNPIWQKLAPVVNKKVIELDSSPYFNQGYSSVGKDLLVDEIVEMLDAIK